MRCNPKGSAEARAYNDNNQVTPMSKEEINAIETILDQCKILHSHSQKLLATNIAMCISHVLRNQTTEPEESDD